MKQPKITLTGILAMLSTRASHVPFYARLQFASHLLSHQPASASSMIRWAWR